MIIFCKSVYYLCTYLNYLPYLLLPFRLFVHFFSAFFLEDRWKFWWACVHCFLFECLECLILFRAHNDN
ncbi:hypothetical protein M6B38_384325 [Iris pallida]|uniref:Uncharacterized protein n=1 Tax=Iris pallida TaxID=29817 RepID=A0AAX6G4A4_IRIPA|nr:hypothetical protein M6B38_384325 [Iris pallida]